MKKIISIVLLLIMIIGTLPAFASGENPVVTVYGDYISGNCVITGTSYMGEGSAVTLRVQGPSGDNSQVVYYKQLVCESNGLFTWSFPMPDNIDAGTYTVLIADRNGMGNCTFEYPFNSTETKLIIEGGNEIIFMDTETVADTTRNTFSVRVKNGSVRDNVILVDGTDFTVTGLPEGLSCTAVGDAEKEAIIFTVAGTAASSVTETCNIRISLKCSAVIPDAGVNSASDVTNCAVLYDYVASHTPKAELDSQDSSLSMRSSLQMSDSTFAVLSKYHTFKQGTLVQGTDFSVTAPVGFNLSASSNGTTVRFTVSYSGSGLASSTSISVVMKPSAFSNGVSYDSNSITVPVSVSSGGTGGGGGGGGFIVTPGKDKNESSEDDKVDAAGTSTGENTQEKPRKVFSDTESHWAKDYIELLAGADILNGVNDEVFAPDMQITRAEFTAMLVRAAGFEKGDGADGFNDVKESDWFFEAVYAGRDAGIINGNNGNFYPNNPITREEMTKMIVGTFEKLVATPIDTYPYATFFNDFDDISEWAKDYVHIAAFFGLVNGTQATVFSPKANTTRAEAAAVIYRMLDKCENINTTLEKPVSESVSDK